MTIGEKIKQLRTEKGFSQENVYPTNQSLVSQIEKSVNKNPTEQTLRIMSQNMGLSFEELIDGTTWENKREALSEAEYAISHTQVIVKIEDDGNIIVTRKYYTAFDSAGNKRLFDPDTGYRLATNCEECNSSIQKPDQLFCFTCGKQIFWGNLEEFTFFTELVDESGQRVRQAPDYGYYYIKGKGAVAVNSDERISKQYYLNDLIEDVHSIWNALDEYGKKYKRLKQFLDMIGTKNMKLSYMNKLPIFEKLCFELYEDEFTEVAKYYRPDMNLAAQDTDHLSEISAERAKSFTIITGAYFYVFDPLKEDAFFENVTGDSFHVDFLPKWLQCVSELSFYEGIIKELKRHKIRLMKIEEQQEEENDSPTYTGENEEVSAKSPEESQSNDNKEQS